MRATPLDSKIPSPAELLMGRRITTSLPYHDTPIPLDEENRQHLQEKRESQKINHDQRAGPELPPLHAGQAVSMMDTRTGTWEDGSVKKLTSKPRSYIVETPRGTLLRNRKHMREAPQAHVPSTSMTSANGKFDDHLSTPSAEPSSAATDQAAQTTAETKADTPSPGQFVTRSERLVVLKGLSQCRTQPDSSIYYYYNDDDAMQRAMLRMDYCLREMAQWMSDNKLKLNDNNSKVIVFNPSNTGTPEHFRTFSICGTDIATKTSVKDLGVYFERNLSIEQQVKAICASCYFHLATFTWLTLVP
ncbi:hypothetical protein CAPTEDRAFT_213713 [Capitella teleta]|uniref:Uncharacterized protein n=1 Tax=Capitella teleta TaxID=283909 RepID=R7UPG7_CAPTE|nr:hypothetical protein CAPTEDRAFT_213713 [Capitella teleta]|eukprot:ELU07998.1 hypothetical protein CAPTEDRAFT_213713 [Capitella teleta]